MIINFINSTNQRCYMSLAQFSKDSIKGYVYVRSERSNKFILWDVLDFNSKDKVNDYLVSQDSNFDKDKLITFGEELC